MTHLGPRAATTWRCFSRTLAPNSDAPQVCNTPYACHTSPPFPWQHHILEVSFSMGKLGIAKVQRQNTLYTFGNPWLLSMPVARPQTTGTIGSRFQAHANRGVRTCLRALHPRAYLLQRFTKMCCYILRFQKTTSSISKSHWKMPVNVLIRVHHFPCASTMFIDTIRTFSCMLHTNNQMGSSCLLYPAFVGRTKCPRRNPSVHEHAVWISVCMPAGKRYAYSSAYMGNGPC